MTTTDSILPISDLIHSSYHASTLCIFARLQVFDFIAGKGEGGASVEEIAAKESWSVQATSGMMISLATSKLVAVVEAADGETHSFQHRYTLTDVAGRFLCKSQPGNVCSYLELFWEVSPKQLLEKSKAGREQKSFMLETGSSAPDEWFIEAMQGQSSYASMVLCPLMKDALEGSTHIIDVGGGSGTFCIESCKAISTLKGSVYELAGVCPITEKFIVKAGLEDRIRAVPGNMFKDETYPSADVYAFGNVIHDWSDEDNTKLLAKAYKSLPESGGKVVLLEMLVSEDVTTTAPSVAGLNLVMVCNEDGRQYKASELKGLFADAGFDKSKVQVVSSPLTPYSVVIASK